MGDDGTGLAALQARLLAQASALSPAAATPLSPPSYLELVSTAQRVQELSRQVLELCVQ
jgi:hypothetical protein